MSEHSNILITESSFDQILWNSRMYWNHSVSRVPRKCLPRPHCCYPLLSFVPLLFSLPLSPPPLPLVPLLFSPPLSPPLLSFGSSSLFSSLFSSSFFSSLFSSLLLLFSLLPLFSLLSFVPLFSLLSFFLFFLFSLFPFSSLLSSLPFSSPLSSVLLSRLHLQVVNSIDPVQKRKWSPYVDDDDGGDGDDDDDGEGSDVCGYSFDFGAYHRPISDNIAMQLSLDRMVTSNMGENETTVMDASSEKVDTHGMDIRRNAISSAPAGTSSVEMVHSKMDIHVDDDCVDSIDESVVMVISPSVMAVGIPLVVSAVGMVSPLADEIDFVTAFLLWIPNSLFEGITRDDINIISWFELLYL